MDAKKIAGLVLLGLFIILCIQNVEVVPLNFLFWSSNISKLLLLIITLIIGILIGVLIPGILKSKNIENETLNKKESQQK